MTGRMNYRVKIDLSRYHQDVRRYSWIYVNGTDVWFIDHLKNHIRDVFNINEPFHLMLNGNEYLPPAEDVRILNENEIVKVLPGTGINDSVENLTTMSLPSSDMENGYAKDASTKDESTPYRRRRSKREAPHDERLNAGDTIADVSRIDATMYHTVMDITEIENSLDLNGRKDDNENGVETSADGARVETRADDSQQPPLKRKRIRRRRSIKRTTDESRGGEIVEACEKRTSFDKTKIPKDARPSSSVTHIRFDDKLDDGDNGLKIDDGTSEANRGATDENRKMDLRKNAGSFFSFFKSSKPDEQLSNLLALKHCSSPLTFPNNKKIKFDTVNGSDRGTKNNDEEATRSANGSFNESPCAPRSNSNGIEITGKNEKKIEYESVKPEEYPCLGSIAKVDDVVAFKVLRMGAEYAPEVSEYVIAKVVNVCANEDLCTFEILRGQTEIANPLGKFSLPDEETKNSETETVEFKFSQLIEPRLIDRK